jgi:seryl-tRNA synthetase
MGEDGLYARSGEFERILAGLDGAIGRTGAEDGAEILRFPPAISRIDFERSEYMKGFPQLAGTVHAFCGGHREHATLLARLDAGEEWSGDQAPTGIVLAPAACYPLYPIVAARGDIASSGSLFDLQSYCFRHEPSHDPARMQMFRMHEFVRIGSAEQVLEFRETWIARARKFISELRMPCEVIAANDPFFGRTGKLLQDSQREQGLKLELVIPIAGAAPTACLSFNYHQDHFAKIWKLQFAGGNQIHTGCVGFGLERLVLALFRHHGFEPERWPSSVRRALWG